jgi:sec-independent protein translocase protein TatA
MNIFGVGGMELIFILIIMLVVAGPKRMIKWAYILGQYTSKLRRMWEETVDVLQKEMDDAGVDVKIPRDLPTQGNLRRMASSAVNNAVSPVTKPIQETINEVDRVKQMAVKGENGHVPETPPAAPRKSEPNLGAWSGQSSAGEETDS